MSSSWCLYQYLLVYGSITQLAQMVNQVSNSSSKRSYLLPCLYQQYFLVCCPSISFLVCLLLSVALCLFLSVALSMLACLYYALCLLATWVSMNMYLIACSTLLSVALLGFVAVFFFYDMCMKLVFFFPVNKRMLSTYCGIGIPGVLRQYDYF